MLLFPRRPILTHGSLVVLAIHGRKRDLQSTSVDIVAREGALLLGNILNHGDGVKESESGEQLRSLQHPHMMVPNRNRYRWGLQ